jgi:predicted DNA-binding protein (MmcQ/YjbR family)
VAKQHPAWKRLRAHALGLPEAYEEFPWGDRVAKVRKEIFVFLGEGAADSSIAVKLRESLAAAQSMPGITPTGYGLGKAGWVTIPLAGGPPVEILIDWIDESYELIAPRKRSSALRGGKRQPAV